MKLRWTSGICLALASVCLAVAIVNILNRTSLMRGNPHVSHVGLVSRANQLAGDLLPGVLDPPEAASDSELADTIGPPERASRGIHIRKLEGIDEPDSEPRRVATPPTKFLSKKTQIAALPKPSVPIAPQTKPLDTRLGYRELDAASAQPVMEYVGSYDDRALLVYARADYLLWWLKDARVPVLATTGAPGSKGILGAPGTSVGFGGSAMEGEEHSGGRFLVGLVLDDSGETAVEAGGFFLGQRASRFTIDSSGIPVLARPYFDVMGSKEASLVTASPGISAGGISGVLPTSLWGIEASLRHNVCSGDIFQLQMVGGFRYLELSDGIHIAESRRGLPGSLLPSGERVLIVDNFDAHNRFSGGQIGAEAVCRQGRFYLNVKGMMALGAMRQAIDINGGEALSTALGTTTTTPTGLLALASNSGRFGRDRFAVAPELGINLGCHVGEHLRAYVGYSFLYMSDVVRSGDQIDRGLDVGQIANLPIAVPAGANRPTLLFQNSDFWAQGMNLGFELLY